MAERQSARMSKITNDGLTRFGTGCFIAVPIWQQWALKRVNIVSVCSLLSVLCMINRFVLLTLRCAIGQSLVCITIDQSHAFTSS